MDYLTDSYINDIPLKRCLKLDNKSLLGVCRDKSTFMFCGLNGYFDRYSAIFTDKPTVEIVDLFLKAINVIDYVLLKGKANKEKYYHHTSKVKVEKILEQGIKRSEDEHSSFGEGIYCYKEYKDLNMSCIMIDNYSGIYYRCIGSKWDTKDIEGEILLVGDVTSNMIKAFSSNAMTSFID